MRVIYMQMFSICTREDLSDVYRHGSGLDILRGGGNVPEPSPAKIKIFSKFTYSNSSDQFIIKNCELFTSSLCKHK